MTQNSNEFNGYVCSHLHEENSSLHRMDNQTRNHSNCRKYPSESSNQYGQKKLIDHEICKKYPYGYFNSWSSRRCSNLNKYDAPTRPNRVECSGIDRNKSFNCKPVEKTYIDQAYFSGRYGYLYGSSNELCNNSSCPLNYSRHNDEEFVTAQPSCPVSSCKCCIPESKPSAVYSSHDTCYKRPVIGAPPKISEPNCKLSTGEKFSNLVSITKYTVNTPLCINTRCGIPISGSGPVQSIVVGYGV